MQPKKYRLSEKDRDAALLAFCVGCPDPAKTRWLIAECLDPMTEEERVDRALNMPFR